MEWWQPGLHQLSARDGWTRGTYRREFVFLLFHFVNSALFFRRHPLDITIDIPFPSSTILDGGIPPPESITF